MEFCCKTAENSMEIIRNEEVSENLSFLFKVLSEPIRIKILLAMMHGEICVRDLAKLLEVSQPRVSNQLKILKLHNLVKSRKDKNNIFYRLEVHVIRDIISLGLNHLENMEG